jgi:hypothetical protein
MGAPSKDSGAGWAGAGAAPAGSVAGWAGTRSAAAGPGAITARRKASTSRGHRLPMGARREASLDLVRAIAMAD